MVHVVLFQLHQPVVVDVEPERHGPVVLVGGHAVGVIDVGDQQRVVRRRFEPAREPVTGQDVEPFAGDVGRRRLQDVVVAADPRTPAAVLGGQQEVVRGVLG